MKDNQFWRKEDWNGRIDHTPDAGQLAWKYLGRVKKASNHAEGEGYPCVLVTVIYINKQDRIANVLK